MTREATRQSPPRRRRWLKRIAVVLGVLIVLAVAAFATAYVRSDNVCEMEGPAPEKPMSAAVYCQYGTPDVIHVIPVEKPVPGDDEILVKVHAASINPLDWHFMEGRPYFMRAMAGLRKPKATRLGVDFAGTVEAVGKNVTGFKPGDGVFGGHDGALADYLTVRADAAVVSKPESVTFEQAASLPIAAITALQAVRDQGHVASGTKLLINGASGGVGTFAVQIAKALGADVTGVCSTKNLDLVRSLGADRTIDYTKDDFAKGAERYDVIIDNVGTRPMSAFRSVLAPQGSYVQVGGGGVSDNPWLGPLPRMAGASMYSKLGHQSMKFFVAHLNKKDLSELGDLVASGKITPTIDRRYPLAEIRAALTYLEQGHARGKVVITMD